MTGAPHAPRLRSDSTDAMTRMRQDPAIRRFPPACPQNGRDLGAWANKPLCERLRARLGRAPQEKSESDDGGRRVVGVLTFSLLVSRSISYC